MQLSKSSPASTPTLAFITHCANTIPRIRYVIYYQIPLFKMQYRPIESLHHQQLLITNSVLLFKILDLEKPTEPPLFQEASFIFTDTSVSLEMSFMQESLKLSGSIINKAEQSEGVKAARVQEISGYAAFVAFRRKYRTIENITRKQEFTLDHRLKITTGGSVFYFTLEQGDLTQHFFNSNSLFVEIQEVYCSGEWKKIQSIMEEHIELPNESSSLTATISIIDKLKVALKVEHINNSNYSNSELASLRILQATPLCGSITIGTDRVKQLASVSPLLGDQFYDYEFGYLSQNISETGGQVYEHINKLTKSFPNYPHLKNGKIINVSGSKCLNFTIAQPKSAIKNVSIPFIYLLFGYNSVQTETHTIKFYIQFTGTSSHPAEQKESRHRVYQLKIKDIWNLGEVSRRYSTFKIKIITPGLTYSIPFVSEEVQASAWKGKAKQLEGKEQQAQFSGSKYYVLTKRQNGKLLITKTEAISQFFLLDLYSSSSITFQIVSQHEIILQGTILRESLTAAQPQVPVILTLSSPNNSLQTILLFTVNEISQNHRSNRTFYKFMYRLEFIDNIPSDEIQYDLEVKRLSDGKKYRSKIGPEMANDGLSTLHMFQGGFFQTGHEDIQISLSLRKMYYDEETEVFDNSEAIHKNICINQAPSQGLVEKLRQRPVENRRGKNQQAKSQKHNEDSVSVFSQKQVKEDPNQSEKWRDQSWLIKNIKEEGYTSVEIDFYDENIKKRLRLYFEIIMRKLPLLDIKKGKYIVKVPYYLWNLNNLNFPTKSERQTSMQVHLATKKRKTEKVPIFSDSPQQYILPQFNYNDGIEMNINGEIGYDKMIDAIKLRCCFTKKQLTWTEDSDEYLAVINVGEFLFYFIVKFEEDTWLSGEDSDGSQKSNRTASKRKSETSNSQKIDSLAKTVHLSELVRLKQMRNKQVEKNRKKTAEFVRHEEMIIKYKRKIEQVEEALAKKDYKEPTYTSHSSQNKQKDPAVQKIKQLYKNLCQCGSKEIMFNGFCENCLKQLRKSYSTYFKEYQQIAEVYERIHFNKFQAKQKYLKVKNKYKLYKQRLSLGQDIEQNDLSDVIKNMEQSDLRRKIEENKILLFRLQAERQKLQESSKVRMVSIEDLIRKEDSEIWEQTISMEQCKQELDELNQTIKKNKKK